MENKDNKNITLVGICIGIVIIIFLFVFISNQPIKEVKSNVNNISSDYGASSSSNSYSSTKKCSAYPCPNDAEPGSSYCSIHKKGKTKKCAVCGKAIWDDETLCDSCLYGSVINSKNKN